jgi:hypothetical protein
LWWTKDLPLPPLVTAGPPGSLGILGNPGTTTLFGGNDVDFDERHGGRFTAGLWLNDCQTFGLEGSYFFLAGESEGFAASSPGLPVLARPFTDALTGTPTAQVVAFPGLVGGTVTATASSRLQGYEANALCNLCCSCNGRIDMLAGFRYLELDEGLGITEDVGVGPIALPLANNRVTLFDQFDTRNRFYGGQLGARGEYWFGRLFVNVVGKVALGSTEQVVGIQGGTTVIPPVGPAALANSGLLALSSNSGRFRRNEFSVVPEVGVNMGVQVTQGVRAFVGYTFLYWTEVARPGDQLDLVLNPNRIPTSTTFGVPGGPARPAFLFRDTDFWAQGINLGLQVRY